MTRCALALACFAGPAVVLAAAGSPAPPFLHARLNVANGCLVESVYFYDQFRERFGEDAWVRVLQWGAREADEVVAGHAVAVFELKDRLWTWDINYGFFPLDLPPAQREDVPRVSPQVLVKYPRITPRYPLYRFDFPQPPEADPPVAALLDEDSARRDASLVAEKLARHRPVKLVQFSYVVDGASKQGAREADEVVAGHAVAVFELKDRLWTWDINYGFFPLDLPPAQREDVPRVSPQVLVKYPRITPRYPLYRFDFPQPPEADPPVAALLDEDSARRDASLVAEKLARHRPVKLVQFSYVVDGASKQGAAAVFKFHGRYCIYFPDRGTVPFHAQGSVKNLRLVQAALRRIFPGAVVLQTPDGE
ncbi:MAG: hypothetical protein PHE83_10335 [Opitutaceae bacterium]|nr:hypothetical protein [Opitutaceae bacterium]